MALKLILTAVALLCIGGAVFVTRSAAARESAALRDYPPLGQFVEIDGVRIHAYVAGDGPDLVLIHGASGNLRDFTFSLVDKLTPHFRVIAFDRPGLGHSDRLKETETINAQARVLRQAAAQLGADKPIIVGQSYGGAVALAWATDAPDSVAGLVLLAAPSFRWDGGLSNFYKLTSSTLGQIFAVPMLTAFVSDQYISDTVDSIFEPQAAPDGYLDYVGAGLTAQRSALKANADQRVTLKNEITEMSKHYDRLTMPIELLHGDVDTIVSLDIHSRPFAEQVPTANLVVLDGIGHMPQHVSQPETLAAIDRIAARAGLR